MNIKNWLKNKKIGVLYGGMSAEREISIVSGKAVLKALRDSGINAAGIDVGRDAAFQIRKNKIDFAYIALHGPWGEDGTIQGMLEIMGVPYSGSGVLANAAAMNKIFSKRIFLAEGLPTPRWQVVRKNNKFNLELEFPVVVKPSTQGSAIGVSIVNEKKDMAKALNAAFKYDLEILIEEYIKGTEITVGVLGNKVLPAIEIVPANKFYDFESKYKPGKSKHIIPPRLSSSVVRNAQELALRAFRALCCKAVSRVDIIVSEKNIPQILEINTIPGMTETSLLPDAARASGINFSELVFKIIEYSI